MFATLVRSISIVSLALCAVACGDDNGGDNDRPDAAIGGDGGGGFADGGPGGGDAGAVAQECAVAVSARGSFTCAVGEEGGLFCWGRNHRGQLGNGATADSSVPVQVALPDSVRVEQVAPGAVHACVFDGGNVYCWGSRSSGQLGDGTIEDAFSVTPVQVPGLDNVVAIASGGFHTCVLRSDDSLWCWGDNVAGQLGDGTFDDRASPVEVATNVAQVTAGEEHTCILTRAGEVRCWGRNDEGELGDGTTTSRPRAAAVLAAGGAPLTGVDEITAGLYHTCARTGTQVVCWGANASGQIDAAPGADRLVATPVVGLDAVATLTAGELHTCATTTTGEVMCWGYNASGQLGQGDIQPRDVPMRVPLPDAVTALDAGDLHTCAVVGGEVWCWGYNAFGQLGDGTTQQATLPMMAQLACR